MVTHPTQLQLEMGHAGEPVSAAVAAHMSTCPECSRFLRTLERERERLLTSESPRQFTSRLKQAAARQAHESGWRQRKLQIGLGSAISMAGTLAMAAIVAGRAAHRPPAPEASVEQSGPAVTGAQQVPAPTLPAPAATEEDVPPPEPPVQEAPRQLSMQAGNRLLAINPSRQPYRVRVPEELSARMSAGERISPVVEICVSAQGSVKSVTIVTGSIAAVDVQLPTVISRWKYRPYRIGGKPEPFCYRTRYSIEVK